MVDSENEAQDCELGMAALASFTTIWDLHRPIKILAVPPATSDEIEFCRWNEETLARE